MIASLPIVNRDGPAGPSRRGVADAIENFPNVFSPRRTDVPQPADSGRVMGFFTDATLCIGCKACEVACNASSGTSCRATA